MSTPTAIPPSDLSKYDCEFVVAVTEDSINATMLEYLYIGTKNNTFAIVELFWTATTDSSGQIVPQLVTDNAAFLKSVGGLDPFSIASDAKYDDTDVQTLYNAGFMFGVRLQIGIPSGVIPSTLGNIVSFGNAASTSLSINQVYFNMYCSTFDVVQIIAATQGEYGQKGTPGAWVYVSQDPNNPWIYSASVNLQFQSEAFENLPPETQSAIKGNTGSNEFSIQQLLFDLANAGLESSPTVSNSLPTGVANALQSNFCGSYFSQMQGTNQPVMGITAVPTGPDPSPLQPTSLSLMLNTYLDPTQNNQPNVTSQLTTLNYLCNTTTTPPSTTPFTWNWVPDAAAQADHDGVLSISRSWFVKYYKDLLLGFAKANCYLPSVSVTASALEVHYAWSLSPNQTPTIIMPTTGTTILQYSYSGDASDETALATVSMQLTTNYTMSVELAGTDTIVITQHLVIYASVKNLISTSGNIVDKQIVDTYTISIGSTGQLIAARTNSVSTDNSQWAKANDVVDWFVQVNEFLADAQTWVDNVIATSFTDVPISTVQGLILPGGKVFTYKGLGFSNFQDLAALITYATPSSSLTALSSS